MTSRLRRSVPRVLELAALVAWAWSLSPRPAAACLILPGDPTLDGAPADGATDVPTDVVPIFYYFPDYEESAEGVPGTFVIETLAGAPVTATARKAAQQWFEIVPSKPLHPNTGYRIRGTWKRRLNGDTFQTQLEFTTGSGPSTQPANVPIAKLQNLDWQPTGIDSCRPPTQATCIAFQQDAIVEYVFIDSFGQLNDEWTSFTKTSFFATPLTPALDQGTNFECVRLRTRAIDGTFSDPVVHCGKDGPVFHVPDDRPVSCKNGGLVVPAGAPVQIDPPGTTRPAGGASGAGAFAGTGAWFAGTGGWFAAGADAQPSGVAGAVSTSGVAGAGVVGGAEAPSPAMGGGDATHGAAGRSADELVIDRKGSPEPSRVESCSVRQGPTRSRAGLSVPFAIAFVGCVMRTRRRLRSRRESAVSSSRAL